MYEIGPIIIKAGKEQTYSTFGSGGGGYATTNSITISQIQMANLLGFDPENVPGGARWTAMMKRHLDAQEKTIEKEYNKALSSLEENLKDEIQDLKTSNPITSNSNTDKIAHELAIYDALASQRKIDLKVQIKESNKFYGGNPIGKSPYDYFPSFDRLGKQGLSFSEVFIERYKSLKAAYSAKLLERAIALLTAQAANVKAALNTAMAAEAAAKAAQAQRLKDAQAKIKQKQHPTAPPGVSVDQNLKEAKEKDQYFVNGDAHLYSWFYTKVRNRGDWDYKQKGRQYESFGNFNYGAVGTAAGIPEGVLLRAAGAAQTVSGTTSVEFGKWWADAPYGDDDVDQAWIKAGIDYAKSKGY
ncbi:polymorphic toxin type 44 domain-containing protein [Pseudomonas tussilaginis]|uniref:polymorphic toxin type 44 domain-containing protein n=1 Tax=Pseudomonas putida TaxID=303 RepID=UPI000FBC8671